MTGRSWAAIVALLTARMPAALIAVAGLAGCGGESKGECFQPGTTIVVPAAGVTVEGPDRTWAHLPAGEWPIRAVARFSVIGKPDTTVTIDVVYRGGAATKPEPVTVLGNALAATIPYPAASSTPPNSPR